MKQWTTAVLVLALSAHAADGGVELSANFDAPLYATCPDAPASRDASDIWLGDAGAPDVHLIDPGASYLPSRRSARIACLLETCDVDRQGKQKILDGPSAPAWWAGWVAAFGTGVSVALGLVGLYGWLKK